MPITQHQGTFGWIVVSLIAPGDRLYFRGAERYIPSLLDYVESQYHRVLR